jgi:hypothetical protein
VDGGYTLTFEERLMSDSIGPGPRDYGVGASCSTSFEVGRGGSVVVVRVAFPQPSHESRSCQVHLSIESAS